jgi:hypothetical protein
MTDQEIRDTIRQMLTDWNAATPAQRASALTAATAAAEAAQQRGLAMSHTERVAVGSFTAVFTRGADAKRFYDRLVAHPAGDYAVPESITLNRKGGRMVSWQAAPKAFEDHGRDSSPGIFQYWADMAETVGSVGSTFGEPPFGAGRRTAYLNGMPGQAEM